MKKAIALTVAAITIASVLQYAVAVSKDQGGEAREFADEAAKGARLYRECFTSKIQASCDALDAMNQE